jgi:hypothetical protein
MSPLQGLYTVYCLFTQGFTLRYQYIAPMGLRENFAARIRHLSPVGT